MIKFSAKIQAIEYCLGEIKEDNLLLKRDNPDWRMDDIESKTGVSQRWICKDSTTAVDLAYKACEEIFNKISKDKIDTLILVTQSADYFLPTSACILQDRLSLSKSTKCFDINLGCSGFVYGLSIASSFIESGLGSNVLLVCADTYSKYIDKHDRTNRPIFSDAASATLVVKSNQQDIGPFLMGTDGSGYNHLIVENGASKSKYSCVDGRPKLHMNGSSVFMFTISEIPQNINQLLKEANVRKEDVGMYIFHQASKIVLDSLKENLNIENNKFFYNSKYIGNTVSSSIPIALKEASNTSAISEGDLILISGFGVGLSWGSCLLNWREFL